MNKLTQVSQVLYEREILEKNKEIAALKKKLAYLETPIKKYENFTEWEQNKYAAFKIIEKSLAESIISNYDEFKIMLQNKSSPHILSDNQHYIIKNAIQNALLIMSQNPDWSDKKATELIIEIQAMLSGYKTICILKESSNNLKVRTEIARMIQQFIKYQFERANTTFPFSNLIINNSNSIYNSRWSLSPEGLFIEMAEFKCLLCKNYCNLTEISPDLICSDCQ